MNTINDYKKVIRDEALVVGTGAIGIGALGVDATITVVKNVGGASTIAGAVLCATSKTVGDLGRMIASDIKEGIKEGKPKEFIEKVAGYKAGV